jgi:ATP-binding protein involved in chromosome partitioning
MIVTTPQEVALDDVRRSVEMFQKMKIPIVGVLENMSHHVCSGCGKHSHIFGKGGAEKLASEFNVPVLGHIPMDEAAMEGGETGVPIVAGNPASLLTSEYHTAAAAAWHRLRPAE